MDSIKVLARKARKFTEQFAKEHPDIGNPSDLNCYCAIGSWILFSLAEREGYSPKFVEGTYLFSNLRLMDELNHCWVEVDGIVCDITATQFGFSRKIMIRRRNNLKHFRAVNKYCADNMASDFLKDWGDQNPELYRAELLELIQTSS
jgi:hypothetical protein